MRDNKKIVLMIAHGSRINESKYICEKVRDDLEGLTGERVEIAYMELAKPSIEEKVEELYNDGYRRFVVLPFFLFSGMHIKSDIPEILNALCEKYGISYVMARSIEYDRRLADILKERLQEIGDF